MKYMKKKKTMLRRPILVLGGLLLSASLAQASPVTLSDNVLDGVTAGTANQTSSAGGVIVGNSSSAVIVKNGVVSIDGAQESARAVNMVTSTDSLVGNGFNLLSGRSELDGFSQLINNEQNNNILQDQLQSASVPDYVRSEANVNKTSMENSQMKNEGFVKTEQKILGQTLKAGKGVSIAGSLKADLDGGNILFDNFLDTDFETAGQVDIIGGLISGKLTSKIDIVTAQHLDWTLPDLDLDLKIAGCFVIMGECKADGSFDTTLDTTENIRSPFSLKNAEAEYIVVDESQLNVTSTYGVSLLNGAQKDARAVNLVNASGSTVANGVNIARTPVSFNTINLSQTNTIVQRY